MIRFGVLNLAAVEMQVTLLVSFRTQKKCHNVRVIKACYHDAKTILYIWLNSDITLFCLFYLRVIIEEKTHSNFGGEVVVAGTD